MRKLKSRIGEKFITNQGYEIEIVEYFGVSCCSIKFNNGVILYGKQYGHVKRGDITNPYHKSVFGVGYIGQGIYKTTIDNKITKVYNTWKGVLERGYDKKCHERHPTYVDCKVYELWHNFQNFAKWYENNYIEGFHLDKDILIKGNKIYSPETCCFVPQEINALFTSCKAVRGKYPIGVTKKGNKYEARVNKNGDRESQGLFDTPEEAFQAYKTAKELWIKEVADKWRGQIAEPCYEAMYAYEVEITD